MLVEEQPRLAKPEMLSEAVHREQSSLDKGFDELRKPQDHQKLSRCPLRVIIAQGNLGEL